MERKVRKTFSKVSSQRDTLRASSFLPLSSVRSPQLLILAALSAMRCDSCGG